MAQKKMSGTVRVQVKAGETVEQIVNRIINPKKSRIPAKHELHKTVEQFPRKGKPKRLVISWAFKPAKPKPEADANPNNTEATIAA